MRSRTAQGGVIIGALLTAMVIVALPRSAAASGWRCGFARPYHSFHSRHRFRGFHQGFHHHGFHGQRFHYTGHGHVFDRFKQVRDHHGYVRQGLGYGSTLIIFRR
jgi:hypothetical protein